MGHVAAEGRKELRTNRLESSQEWRELISERFFSEIAKGRVVTDPA